MRTPIIAAIALSATVALAEAQDRPAPGVVVTGTVGAAAQQIDNDTNSSKFSEYRDLRDQFFAPQLRLNLFDQRSGLFFDLSGSNVSRRDQSVGAALGRAGVWTATVDWVEVPHNFSNRAQTPYIRRGPGLFEVPATVPITFKKLATAAADAPGVVASDALIAAYQSRFLHSTPVDTQNNFGRLALDYAGFEPMRFGAAYDIRRNTGLRAVFGPIGDRPPRTLNIQLTEPVDHRNQDVSLSAERITERYALQLGYQFSDFANRVDTLVWQNVYATAAPDAAYDTWDRAVALYGRRPLAPDNRYHNASVAVSADLPLESRLSVTGAYGRMDQDEALLPYNYTAEIAGALALPRASAEARIDTRQLLVEYSVSPRGAVNLRAWGRYYGLDNDTPQDRWQYVTSDTANLNGTVSYKNKRVNLAYETDRTNLGVDATWRVAAAKSTLSLGYEREGLAREFREADTVEHRLSAGWRARLGRRANLRARYVFGDRGTDGYNDTVTFASYWYAAAEAGTDADNPAFTFSNHPDMRRSDVSDRRRNQLDVTLSYAAHDAWSASGSVRYRNDDFASDVASIQPLTRTGTGDQSAATPGQQLGLLEDSRLRYAADLFWMPDTRVTLNAFAALDSGETVQRGLEFNENNKMNPAAVAAATLGPWTRGSSQWTADTDDRTWSAGLGATVIVIPDRLTVAATYTASLGELEIAYDGFGVTSFNGDPLPPTHEFAFPASPPAVTQDLHVFDLRFDIPIVRQAVLALGYSYERFSFDDWQQEAPQTWVETVGSEFLLRDTSRSHQWGNRLFNLGTPLAPAYGAHLAYASMTYRF